MVDEEEWVDLDTDGKVDRAIRYDDGSLEGPTSNSDSDAEE